MLPLIFDLTTTEVPAPDGRLCRSGHVAPLMFRREGAGTLEKPTRFFEVTSLKSPAVNGVYCEPCLMIANALADARRSKR